MFCKTNNKGIVSFKFINKVCMLLNEKILCFPILKCFGERKYTNVVFLCFFVNFLEKYIPRIFRKFNLQPTCSLYKFYSYSILVKLVFSVWFIFNLKYLITLRIKICE